MNSETPRTDYETELKAIFELATALTDLGSQPRLQDCSRGVAELPGILVIANTQKDNIDADA